jgi:hypothetical protein
MWVGLVIARHRVVDAAALAGDLEPGVFTIFSCA